MLSRAVADVTKSDERLTFLVEVCRDLCQHRIDGIHFQLQSLLRRVFRNSFRRIA